ncbi:PREDICTED: pectinesterase, partial [Prunus dulcis]
NTELHVLGTNEMTVITAQARASASKDTGYSFVHCNITGTGNGTYLGRAWRISPRVVFAYTSMSEVITPAGWNNRNRAERD